MHDQFSLPEHIKNLDYALATYYIELEQNENPIEKAIINSNIGDAEKFRPENLRNTGYNVSEGTMAHLRSIHASGIDPVELGEILKEGIENERIIVLPDHRTGEERAAQLRGLDTTIENYCLTGEQRQKIMEERMAEMAKNRPEGAPARMGWAVPEGAEAFGKARKDLDWIDKSKMPDAK